MAPTRSQLRSKLFIVMMLVFPQNDATCTTNIFQTLNLGLIFPRKGHVCSFLKNLFHRCDSLQIACNFFCLNRENCKQALYFRNSRDGSIPSEIGLLTQMKELYLTPSSLSGTIPSTLGLLSQLESFIVTGNLIGTIPSTLGNLRQLRLFSLDSINCLAPFHLN
jgi:hypothetical protein